jgi:hypothetical protein
MLAAIVMVAGIRSGGDHGVAATFGWGRVGDDLVSPL